MHWNPKILPMSGEEIHPEDHGNLLKFFPRVEFIETLLLHDELFFRDPGAYTHELNVDYNPNVGLVPSKGQTVCCFSWMGSVLYDPRMWKLRADAGTGACVIFHDIPMASSETAAYDMLSHKMSRAVYVTLAGYSSKEELEEVRAELSKNSKVDLPPIGNLAFPLEPETYEYEHEYRLFCTDSPCPPGEYINFNAAMYFKVKGIVFGYHMDENDKKRIRHSAALAGKSTIRFYDMAIDMKAKLIGIGSLKV